MNLLDAVLLLLLVLVGVRGFRRGAVSQVAAFGGAAVGLVVGALLGPRIAGYFIGEPGPEMSLLVLVVLLLLVFIGQGVGMGIGLQLRRAAHGVGAAALDRGAGIAVGLAGLLLTVWLLAAALVHGPFQPLAQQLRDSAIVAAIDERLPPAPDVLSRAGSYLDRHGFPQVFHGVGRGPVAPPVDPPAPGVVAAAQQAAAASTVQVQSTGCGAVSSGSGFVVSPGFIVTNAHVVAGGDDVTIRDGAGLHPAVPIHFDPTLDLAVLAAPAAAAPAIGWTPTPAGHGLQGATLGFPGGRRELVVQPAAVRARTQAIGRDIYGRELAHREVLILHVAVRRGDSGGPFVTGDGVVAGVVFAAAPEEPTTGYALAAERVRPDVEAAMARNTPVGTGPCRY
jgi:S1-C subfamily serine protease